MDEHHTPRILVAGKTGELKRLENPVQNPSFESIVSARPTAAPRIGGET